MSSDKILKAAKAVVKGSRLATARCLWAFSSSSFTLDDGEQKIDVFIEGNYAEKLGADHKGIVDLELALLGDCAGVVARESEFWEPGEARETDQRCTVAQWKQVEFVAIATDQESGRYQLSGVCFDGRHAVATDGRRLHIADLGFTSARSNSNIVPSRAIACISALLKIFKPDSFFIRFSATKIEVFCEFFQFSSRLVEGRFPNWEAVCPADSSSFSKVLLGKDLIEVCKTEEKIVTLKNKGKKNVDLLLAPKVAVGDFDSLNWQRVDCRFLREALAGLLTKSPKVLARVPDSDNLAIVLDGGDLSAVIQPFSKRNGGPKGSKLDESKLTYNEVLARSSAGA